MNNNWYVITGAPSSGKTTLVKALEKKGYAVVYEVARQYIDEEIRKGRTIDEIRKDEGAFQQKVLELKVALEQILPKNTVTFFDRGIPDTKAYLQLIWQEETEFLVNAVRASCYRKVFLLEMSEYIGDYARTESAEAAKELESLLEQSYRNLGFEVIKIPPVPTPKRLELIESHLVLTNY